MAMAMPQPWGKKKIGSWADESEASDSDSLPPPPPPLAPAPASAPAPEDGFPSLSKPAATGPKKKTKGQTLTLSEFTTGKHLGPGASKRSSTSVSSSSSTPSSTGIFMSSDRLTPEELLYLPTGPKDRSGDEPQEPRFGFRSYGGFRNEPRRPEREREPPTSMPPPPSRADESSDWFSSKNPRDFQQQQQQQAPRRFDHPPHSKADEVESWSQGKSTMVRPEVDHGFMEWGGGRRGMHAAQIPRSDPSDRWREDGGGEDERWPRRMEELPQRRRLNLQPRSLPVESSPAAATSPPVSGLNPGSRASSGEFSSRPGTPSSPVPSESKPRVNPFGSAKPREMVLQERGQDWRKLDLELEHKRVETEEEKRLKQEIVHLKDELLQGESPEIKQQLENKELELGELTKELESKARVTPDTQQPPRPQSSHDTWSRPPSSHGTRSRNVNSSDTWRRPRTPIQEQEWSRRSSGDHQFHQQHQQHHRPSTASGDYYNRPRTPDLWRRDSDQHHHLHPHHQHNNHFNNHHFSSFNNNSNENDQFGRADMWSRPRTPSVHDPDEWNSGRSTGTTPTAAAAGHASRW